MNNGVEMRERQRKSLRMRTNNRDRRNRRHGERMDIKCPFLLIHGKKAGSVGRAPGLENHTRHRMCRDGGGRVHVRNIPTSDVKVQHA